MSRDDHSVSGNGIDAISLPFDLVELETFLAVAELGSFSAAAKKMHVSQPSVTNRVQRLEAMPKTTSSSARRAACRSRPTARSSRIARGSRFRICANCCWIFSRGRHRRDCAP